MDSDDEEVPILVNMAEEDEDGDDAPQLVVMEGEEDEELLVIDEEEAADESVTLPPVPVTILSGFLGSGKTTLVQYILQSPDHGKRIAVIENEFGGGSDGISIESIIARDGLQSLTDLIELPNGCVCCTVKDDLIKTLEALLDKRKDLDYILIESSGMANPGPIASIFWLDDALESRLRLDGVVTLVDALNIAHQLEETEEAAQQIAYADRVLLNKVDLVNGQKQEEVFNTIRALHPTVPIRATTYSQVPDLEWILDAQSFGRAMEIDNPRQIPLSLAYCMPVTTILSDKHTSAVGSSTLVHRGSVDLKRINAWLATLLWPNQDESDKILRARLESNAPASNHASQEQESTMQLFRIKGILSVKHSQLDEEDEPFAGDDGIDTRRFIVQGVYDLWEIHPASVNLSWDAGEERFCKLIVIGRHLQNEKLESGFQSCFV
ncbi:CobW/HypB/UreG [Fragilaria crotonensis]|nr:CobW/HypB/UreG [Fragilaria crotonensis]